MSSIRTAEFAPLALSILGMDTTITNPATTQSQGVTAPAGQSNPSPSQQSRPPTDRRTSHYNSFQTRCSPSTDSPPSYATTARSARFPVSPRRLDNGSEVLPHYTPNVLQEGQMYMRIERISPFQFLPKQEWRSIYVILRGTQLCIHKIKTSHLGAEPLHGPGKLIRKYTLQHAEVGMATDVNDHVLVPVTKFAHLIPAMARKRAFNKDSSLFRCDKQHALRLRVETDQLLLADCSEEVMFKWVNSLCAGIDIAFPIDERSLPKQCTVPRRRRQRRAEPIGNLEDARLVAEQERILRQMYPTLARSVSEIPATTEMSNNDNDLHQSVTVDFAQAPDNSLTLTPTITNLNYQQDAEDIDLSAMAEDASSLEATISRPQASRQTTATTLATLASFTSTPEQTIPANFDANGKWTPVHPRSATQQHRYTRRCLPILLFDSPRCSNIVICHGRRLRINHRMDMLEEWELEPPTYDAHNFSMLSADGTVDTSSAQTTPPMSVQDVASTTRSGSDLDIQPVRPDEQDGLGALLEKTQTKGSATTKFDPRHVSAAAEMPVIPARSKIDEHSPLESEFSVLINF